MYETLTFAENRSIVSTRDLSTAISVAESLLVTPHFTTVGALIVNENATLTNGTTKKITKYGFERFCGILGIPRPFARKIPEDLLFENIQRLQKSQPDLEVVILQRPDGDIASIVSTPYDEYTYGEMLAVLGEKPDIASFEIGERFLRMDIDLKKTMFSAKDPNDFFYVRNFIIGSIVKETSLHSYSGLYRTICSNSFIGPYMGNIKANYMLEKTTRLLRFASICANNYSGDVYNRMSTNMKTLPDKLLNEHEFVGIWKNVKTVIGNGEADAILKTSEEERKQIMRRVNVWQKENVQFKLEGIALHSEVPMPVLAYDAVNAITERSQAFNGPERIKLEKIGGDWLRTYLLN